MTGTEDKEAITGLLLRYGMADVHCKYVTDTIAMNVQLWRRAPFLRQSELFPTKTEGEK